ncbi:MAG: FAD-dependent oxidoreductase [Bacilli bacterium]
MSNLKKRICIVGGGPAGLSAAMYLEKKGYKNYVIYEKDGEVGGKCHSPMHNGKRYETGAIMGVPSYYAVHDIEEFAGVTHDGPQLNRNYKTLDGKTYDPFNAKKFWRIPHLLKMKKQVKILGELLETKYKGYDINGHRGVSKGEYSGYDCTPERKPVSGVNPNLKDLCLPFSEFCKLNHVELTQDIWIGPFTAFGYGYFDEIPAAYVLKYLDFQTCMNFVKCNLWTWKNGTQSIYEALNGKLLNHAILNSNITKVVRKDGKVTVTVNGAEEVFDKIIVTAPLQYMENYFDVTKDEKELFSKIDFERYDVLGTLPQEGKYPPISFYIFDNMDKKQLGHLMVYYCRWRGETDQVITTYALRKHKDTAEIPYEDCKKTVLDDLKICGADADKVVFEKSWYYFPHVFSKDYADGWYEKVEGMQGTKNTYYAGEIMSFGDMDETCEYSRELVERFF